MTCNTLNHVNQASIEGDISKRGLPHTINTDQVHDLVADASMQVKYGKWGQGNCIILKGAT